MTSDEPAVPVPPPAQAATAGALLRAARERQGLHIAALAASIKVTPAKLDALENDRYQELPDATFTRALAQSVCRVLKVDARPVLDLLPTSRTAALERVDAGLKTPFRERAAALEPPEWSPWRQPAFWIVLALLAAAAAFWLLPGRGLQVPWPSLGNLPSFSFGSGASGPAAPAATPAPGTVTESVPVVPAVAPPAGAQAEAAPATTTAPISETVHSAPVPAGTGSGSLAAESAGSMLVMRADEASWVEVQDARGLVLFSRTLQPGETVGLNGSVPIKVKVGNAGATQVQFQGKPVDVQAATRDNVARLELR
jgi:cytoskeleton protein RodZ